MSKYGTIFVFAFRWFLMSLIKVAVHGIDKDAE
jgi:hypothetical protein